MMKQLNLLYFALLLGTAPLAQAQQYVIPQGLKPDQYVSGQLIFKLRENYRSIASDQAINSDKLNQILAQLGGGTIHKNYIGAKQPSKKFNENGERLADLSLIYELRYSGNTSIYQAAALLQKTGLTEYVQPRFTAQPMAVPNDPLVAQQYHHALIKTFEAWDIEPGDSTVLIGITDGGIQFDHEDLGNWQYNYAENINGIDDDGNGYIDDIAGWNSANNTNDPTATLSPHGMFTSGMSNATADNGLGLAGNAGLCRYVPIRIDDATGFNYGYEGIVYAAARGCQIINASWGNTFPSPATEEAIRYATVNQGVLIVAACGNSGLNEKYYPAFYENVMSVGATGSTDVKWSGSTYNTSVDIVAPGELVRSCWPFNGYDISSGTSFSSPLVAGAAALVKSHFPSYTAQQVAERLRVTADNSIYTLPGNSAWTGLMGSGRLNMLRALTDPDVPSVHFIQPVWEDAGGDQTLEAGETVHITGFYKNFLAPSSNLQAVISCSSPYVTIISGTNNPGAIGTLATVGNSGTPFQFQIAPNAPYNLDLIFRIDYTDVNYSAFEFLEVRVNRDYLNIDINHLHTTITSRGSIGYNADYATDGLGVTLDSSASIIYASGFMLGSSAGKVADNVYASTIPGYDNDFVRQNGAKYLVNNANQQMVRSAYYTDSASTSRLLVNHMATALSNEEDGHAVMMMYTVKNIGNAAANGLSAGIFTDWDIQNAANNQGAWDAARNLSYAFQPGGIYAGVKVLEGPSAHAYCFNSDGSSGSINLYDGYTGAEKFATLSGAQTRTAAPAGDIANLIGTGSFNLAPGDSISIKYVMLIADDLTQLQAAADRAQSLFNYLQLQVVVEALDESCAQNDGYVQLSAESITGSSVELSNSDGVTLTTSNDLTDFSFGGLVPGDYLLTYSFADGSTYEESFSIGASFPVTLATSASAEVLALPNASVDFTANANGDVSYFWDFNDDSPTSEEQNPTHNFFVAGTYLVSCVAYNGYCSDTSFIEILVGDPLKIEQLSKSFNLFPNPVNDQLNIQIQGYSGTITCWLYSTNGQLIQQQKFSNNANQLDVSNLSAGVYFLKIDTDFSSETHRICIAKN